MNFKKAIFFVFLMISVSLVFPQGAAINNTGSAADPSAILDVSSIDKGALLPRMTDVQRNAIVNPADGLIIYNTVTKCINLFKSGSWFEICGNCVPPATPVAGNNSPVCSGDTIKLTSTAVPNATYSWTGPNGFTSTLKDPKIPNSSTANSGIYSVVATVGACSSSAAVTTVTVNQSPSSAFTMNPTSAGINTNITFTPNVTGATYSWVFQGGTPATSTIQNPVVQWGTTGTFNITLTVTQAGCTSGVTTNNITISSCGSIHGSQTFNYTGSAQTWQVPVCVTSISASVYGAQGGSGYSGNTNYGGLASATLTVTPGETLTIYVGSQGSGVNGGFNGGGPGAGSGYGGGGASDIRQGGTSLNERIIVGAGGGGGSYWSSLEVVGGKGGGLTGEDGYRVPADAGGQGGTQTGSGTGTCSSMNNPIVSGGFGYGGNSNNGCGCDGYGGGSGWYGGAGSGNCRGGGGGSNYVTPTGSSNVVHTRGVKVGDGQIIITW
ncbi:MAG: glycine-rich protein [Bacteroidota bacterium]